MPALCRICYGPADGSPGGQLVTPCHCGGTMAHIHGSCLAQWQAYSRHPLRCDVCRAPYQLPGAGRRRLLAAILPAAILSVAGSLAVMGAVAALGAAGVASAKARQQRIKHRRQQRRQGQRMFGVAVGVGAAAVIVKEAIAPSNPARRL